MLKLLRKNSMVSLTLDRLADLSGFTRFASASGFVATPAHAVDVMAVLCGVRVIAEGVAQSPVRVVRERFAGQQSSIEIARAHPVHRLLAVRPNGWQTPFEFVEYAIWCAALGEGFLAEKVRDREGQVRELLPIPLGNWSVNRNADWSLEFTVTTDAGTRKLAPGNAFYLRGPGLDGFRGLPVVQAAREAIGLAAALESTQTRLAKNGGKPSGVLSFKNLLAPEAKDRFREKWQDSFGPGGDGGIAILDGEARYSSITMTAVDAQHIETRKHQIEEIARGLRVQPIMLMHPSANMPGISAEQFFRTHVVHTLGPWFQRFEQTCNRDLLADDPEHRADCDERALLRGDFKDQAQYYTQALGAGGAPAWMTVNEVRGERGLNPVDDPWANTVSRGGYEASKTEGTGDG